MRHLALPSTLNDTASIDATTRLQRIGTAMCCAVALGGAVIELIAAWIWLVPDYVETLIVPRVGLAKSHVTLDGQARLFGFLITSIPLAVLFYLLDRAYRIFDSFRLGDIFTATTPRYLRQIGLAALLLALLNPIASAAISMVLTIGNPPGARMLAITLSSNELILAGFGALILAIGHVQTIANSIAADNRSII
ncbi:MAG: hypothetical protein ABL898_10360 [Hyphomicrobiaceae bacterium]|nr:DUF2975 domain-containing protein [Hyphomicrobiaceae bacterium]